MPGDFYHDLGPGQVGESARLRGMAGILGRIKAADAPPDLTNDQGPSEVRPDSRRTHRAGRTGGSGPARARWSRRVEHGPRPTSHNHEQHLRSAFAHRLRTRREGGRESWLGLAIEFDEPLSIPAIRATGLAWIDRHEVLRSHVVLKPHPPARRRTGTGPAEHRPGTVHLRMGKVGWYSDPHP